MLPSIMVKQIIKPHGGFLSITKLKYFGMKIVITGISGFLGSELAKKLTNHELIGLDIREPTEKFPTNVVFYKKSILSEEINEVFTTHKPDICVHLAWTVNPVHKKKLKSAYKIDYLGTEAIFSQCKDQNVKHIIFMSSTLAYGALRDNDHVLTENDPLRAKKNFHYSYHKRLVETEIVQPFMKENPDIRVTILRPTAFLSKDVTNYVSDVLRAKILPVMIGGKDTRIQFMHLNDLLDVISQIMEKKIAGIYNVAPDDYVIMKELPELLPGHKICVPEFLARVSIRIGWFLHIYNAPSSYLDFVRYEFVASNAKLKRKIDWKPKFSTSEALRTLSERK